MRPIIEKYSTSPDYRPCNLTEALTTRGLFDPLGERGTDWVPWTPTVEEYIGMRHSQSAFSRERMGETAEVFDRETRAILHDLVRDGAIEQLDGRLQLSVQAKILWGRPKRRLT
ncbi:MAG: hypothetical protein JOZ41_02660 [Chloroflexi bacterium]|nr:hypothetical protein [Chloroflexota bacterium]